MHTLSWYTDSFVLVEEWSTSSFLGLLSAMLASGVLCVVYECLKRYLHSWDNTPHTICSGKSFQGLTLLLLRSIIHTVSASASYVIMLFLMTYDLRVMMSCLIGAAIGYFFLPPSVPSPSIKPNRKSPDSRQPDRSRVGRPVQESTLVVERGEPASRRDAVSTATPAEQWDNGEATGNNPDSPLLLQTLPSDRVKPPDPENDESISAEERLDLLLDYLKSETN